MLASSGSATTGRVAVVVLANLTPDSKLRAFTHLAFGRWALTRTPGLVFAKVLGSGKGGGFRPSPSATHQGLFAAFISHDHADAFLASTNPLLASWRRHARDIFTCKLEAYAARGAWSGRTPLEVATTRPADLDDVPVASLTRASIKAGKAARFWRHAPPSEDALHATDGCLVAAGLGEMPLLRQATFTIWDSERAMERYARQGPHLAAIKAAHADGYFSESLFARFVPSDLRGTWAGRTFG